MPSRPPGELADYLKRDEIDPRKQYVLMGSEIWCDKYYALPFDADPRAVYYNKSMLKQAGAPDPWDDRIHFRHDHTVRHDNEYSQVMAEVYALRQPLVDTLREFNRRASSEVTYGACLPYKGMTVPIRP